MEIHDLIRFKTEAEEHIHRILTVLSHDVKLDLDEVKLGFIRTGLDNKRLTSVKIVFEL